MNNSKVAFIHSIRLRLIVAFLVPIIGIVFLGVSSYNRASKALTENYKEQSQQTAEVLRQYIDLITGSETEAFTIYLVDKDLQFYFKDQLDKTAAISIKSTYNDTLREKTNLNAKLSDIYFISDGGKSLMARTVTMADDAYSCFEASSEGQAVLAGPTDWHLFGADDALDAQMGTNVGTYALRWVRKLGNLPQAIVIDFDATSIRETMSVMDAGEGGYVALVTTDGKEFYSDSAVATSVFFGQSYYDAAVSSADISGNQMVKVNGENYLFVYSKFDEQGDMVAALIPESEMLSQTAGIKSMTMLMTIVAIAIAMLLAILISGQMLSTIRYILRKLNKVADGDLTTELVPKGKDEFALLCKGINHTVGNVRDLIVGVNDVSSQVSSSAIHMADASNTFKSTSGNIQAAVNNIEKGAGKLDESSADCLGQMDTLSGKIGEVSVNADEIGRLAGSAGEMINSGMNAVRGLTDSAEDTRRITSDVIVAIKALEERSNAIYDIVTAINGIAKQTNLLSLNAGIEAARAGEAGRGFTVVAQQIRVLSAQCMDSANQISSIVDEISDKTAEVVAIASKAEDAVTSQSQVVTDTEESFSVIQTQVNALIEALGTITANVHDIDESRNQTLRSIESISEVSVETSNYSTEVNDATQTQSEAINNLDNASKQLQEKADELVNMMKAFIVE